MNSLKVGIRGVFSQFGLKISRIPQVHVSAAYETVHPIASYSPWNGDAAFQRVYASIDGHTLVDLYRCYELWTMVEQVAKLPGGNIIEIGVWRGGTGALIAAKARACGIKDNVILCDTFTGVVKAGEKDTEYKGGEHADTSRQIVEELLRAKMALDNFQILEGIFPDDTGHLLSDAKFRMCHIDVDAYQSAKDIVDWIWPRMVPGGIVVYDDYGFRGCDGITRYVNEQISCKDRFVLHNLNGHAIVVKL